MAKILPPYEHFGLTTARNYGNGESHLCKTGDTAIDNAYSLVVTRYKNIDSYTDIFI